MIGRGAIRNPWLFEQTRRLLRGEEAPPPPRGREVLEYVRTLFHAVCTPGMAGAAPVQKMKRYMNFLGLGVEGTGQFLHEIRRVQTTGDFFAVCERFLAHDEPMPLEPFHLALKPVDVLAGDHL